MTEAELNPKQGASARFYKALGFSVLLHLILVVLIQPARLSGGHEVVIQAQFATKPMLSADASGSVSHIIETESQADKPVPVADDLSAVSESMPMAGSDVAPGSSMVADRGSGESANANTLGQSDSSPNLPEAPTFLDTRWYTAREVDVHPKPIQPIEPKYPEFAQNRGIQGSVVLQLKIDEFGEVQEVQVLESIPAGVFDEASVKAFSAAKFYPAKRNGRDVRALVKIRVMYELE